jgi:DNA-binding MltR family transcriptional regulator
MEKLLLTKGRTISNKLAKRMFTGMGPLHSFSAKAEIAFFFEVIDKDLFEDLMVVKDIRNAFAHTTRFIRFADPAIAEKCRRLSTWETGCDAVSCFYGRALECIDLLRARMDTLLYAKALVEEPAVNMDEDE